jgi:hypothetical protein
MELKPSLIDRGGVGVFAGTDIFKGERVASGVSKEDYRLLIPWECFAEYEPALQRKITSFCIGTPHGFIPPDNLDFNRLSIEWYFNHSCEGNLGFDERGDFVTRMRVAAGDELAYDYGLAESNPSFLMACHCGKSSCRRIITGNDWKGEDCRRRNIEYMLPSLRVLPARVGTHVGNLFKPSAKRLGPVGSR